MGELDPEAGVGQQPGRLDDPPPGPLLLVVPEPRAVRGGPALGADGGHPGQHQRRAAERLRAELGGLEGARHAVDRRVGGQRRHHDPVAQRQPAELQGPEHRRDAAVGAEPGVDRRDELRVPLAQTLVADPAAAGEQIEGELRGRLAGVAADALEPLQTGLGGALGGLHHRLALGLVGAQRLWNSGVFVQAGGERQGVLHGQLGARADREVRGVRRVAEQHHIAVAPTRVAHRGEVDPARAGSGDQPVPVEVFGQQPLAAPHAALVVAEAGLLPGLLPQLHDEGAAPVVIGVGVHLHDAEVGLLDDEGEGLEDPVGGQPHVAAAALVQPRAEARGKGLPGGRADPVGGHHQVVLGGQFGGGRRLGAEPQVDPELLAAPAQDGQQPPALQGGEAVATGGELPPRVADVDVAPAGELRGHRPEHLRVGLGDPVEGLVGEDHAEPEGVVGGVALPQGDLRSGANCLASAAK